jgi:hypothetical protein
MDIEGCPVHDDTKAPTAKFYGAECPSYPNCTGGCGLGCTHDIEAARALRSPAAPAPCSARGRSP